MQLVTPISFVGLEKKFRRAPCQEKRQWVIEKRLRPWETGKAHSTTVCPAANESNCDLVMGDVSIIVDSLQAISEILGTPFAAGIIIIVIFSLLSLMHGSSRESGGHTRVALPSMRLTPSNGNLCLLNLTPSIPALFVRDCAPLSVCRGRLCPLTHLPECPD